MSGSAADAPVVVDALRTPIGTAGRSLARLPAPDLAAPLVAALAGRLDRRSIAPGDIRDVVLGNCTGPGGDVARVAALQAGLPVSVPGLTVDRQCGSGLAAIAVAAALVRSEPGAVLAGGVESASTAPWRSWPPEDGGGPVRYERAPFAPAALGDPDMGPAADLLARDCGVSREEQDRYAARSHARAVTTWRDGGFDAEVLPVAGVSRDDRPRAGLTVERLARLRPAFRPGGTVTAGNACGVNDGAALVTVVDAGTHRRLGVPGLRVLATATAGVDPNRPGRGLVPATRLALDRAGVTLDEIDVVELNEAFAGQVLACCAELGLDPERVCPEGGALALGHPWGASGAVLAVRLFSQLVRRPGGRLGLAAVAVGGGQGVAMVVEACG
ncbi:acetyl-CoA C-acetyltransferase [Geodermatophilus tzadiensis]|uniref:Acetyl-CoA C-acetyltransferase n=1 Tax=Geodermatophilus tzadiensis TaxID=1137988 RepID=A0A2T0U0G7_9ACTN|nr:thiolase family protein [Geodermatophilus tzadiensis]PRY51328.1 acetyl-CoA C-acetyltransferase [Geodermatophilus tzadiensis]